MFFAKYRKLVNGCGKAAQLSDNVTAPFEKRQNVIRVRTRRAFMALHARIRELGLDTVNPFKNCMKAKGSCGTL